VGTMVIISVKNNVVLNVVVRNRYCSRGRRVPPGTQNILILDAGSEGLGIRLHCRGGNYDLHI
jgi:hypothetical protein